MTKPPSGHMEEPDVVEAAKAVVLAAWTDRWSRLHGHPTVVALDAALKASTPPVTVDDVERLKEHLLIAIDDHDAHFGKANFVGHWTNTARAALEAIRNRKGDDRG